MFGKKEGETEKVEEKNESKPVEKATTAKQEPARKVPVDSKMVEVEVTVDSWGNYKKGDKLKMHSTTAEGCKRYVKVVS